MALSFPISIAQFSQAVRVQAMTLHAPSVSEESRTAAGEVLSASLGPALWQGSMSLAPAYHADARAWRAMVDMLLRPGASFLLWPQDYLGPSGSFTLGSVASNNRDVTVTGASLKPGDYLSFTYGSSPTRYAFHQVVSGTGSTVEVHPPVRAGWTAGATVNLERPHFKAVLTGADPGSFQPGVHGGQSFSFTQTLR